MDKLKIAIITGTRPDIIKMAPIYWEAKKRGHEPILVHTSQHYSHHLFDGVYDSMDLPSPHHILKVGACKTPAQTAGKIILAIDELVNSDNANFDIVLTHGDTLTSMSASVASYLNNVPVGHIEAGLRTFSREPFPEQLDTRCSDAASDLFFAPTKTNEQNLLNEGFDKERIFVVGNSVVDAAIWGAKKGESGKDFFLNNGIDFSLPTIYFSVHRRETTMNKDRFSASANTAIQLAKKGYCVVWSIRPGTKAALKKYGLDEQIKNIENLHPIEEIPSYPHICYLMSKSKFICTDSGSMQEEAAALNVPCITIRFKTDRPESVEAGANILAPPKSTQTILDSVKIVEDNLQKFKDAKNPYGDGTSSSQILDILEKWRGKYIKWEHQE